MKRIITRLTSIFLVLVMLVTFIPATALAVQPEMTLRASQIGAVAGSTVVVTLDLENNPGLAAMKVKVAFDDILTLTNVTFNDAMGGQYQMPQTFASPVSLTWYNGTANFTDENATFATLTFTVSEDAIAGDTAELNITYNPSDVYDITETDIKLNVINGSITIQECVPGDINGDGVTNLKDQSRLFQYLADWDVEVNEPALDTNGDGSVNLKDQSRLFQYLADWDVVLYPIVNKKCDHTMTAVEYKAASCTEDGNIAYWHCSKCSGYFTSETGANKIQQADIVLAKLKHTEVSYSEPGYLDGIKCGVCGEIIKPATPIDENTREIKYDIGNGNAYIESLISKNKVENPNPQYLSNSDTYTLKNPKVEGYDFLGWYDLPAGSSAQNIKKLTPDDGIDTLYAHWSAKIYTIQYKSNLSPIPSETYTVETGAVLDAPPKVSNYVFAGWCDDNGTMYDKDAIPVGTTGHITLTANWISERNKTVTKDTLGEPLIYEDAENGFIYFAYEIGRIENVPLKVIHDFGYLSSDGPNKSWTETYSVQTSETMMEAYSKVVSEATTQSSNWTLSNGWSENTSLDQEWLEQTGLTEGEAIERGTTESGEWYTSSSNGGSTDTTKLDSTESGWKNEIKIENSTEDTESTKIASSLNASIGSESKIIKAEISASLNTETTNSSTNKHGFSAGGTDTQTTFHTDSTVTNSNWNSSKSYTSSKASSETESATRELSKLIAENHHYGQSYILNEDVSNSQGVQSSSSSDEEYSTSVTYSKVVEKTKTETWTTEVSTSGYYRWIVAGTAHVYGIVGYDIANDTYFVNTLSVMDDKTHDMQDYSYASAAYSDNQNGVISFEVPFEVAAYVAEKVCGSDGLNVNQATGEITAYGGTDNCVVIPEYISVGDSDVVKVTGIGSKNDVKAFANNTTIAAVVLSDYITEIPAGAFENCTSLEGVIGGSITKIGSGAFSGCSSLAEVGVSSKITHLDSNAFVGVNKLIAAPSSADVLQAAVNSGAKRIIINLSEFSNNDASLNGLTITVPEGTEYFELNGYGKSFTGLSIVSNADETVIKKINLTGNGTVPLTVVSPDVVLNQVSIQASGLALVLSAENTRLGLQSTINATTVKSRSLELYEIHTTVDGLLTVSDTLYTTNDTIVGTQYLSCNNIVLINNDAFDGTQHTAVVTFDANGGSSTSSKTLTIGKAFGTLPSAPTREGYDFAGWYTAASGGTQVTESTICTGVTTVYAHWTVKTYTASWNNVTGCTIAVNRTSSPYAGAATGALSSGDTVYYGDVLSIVYQPSTGWLIDTKGRESMTVYGNVTGSDIYATTYIDWHRVSWSNGETYTIGVERTGSPIANAYLGALNNGDVVYYGDMLSIVYVPKTGYSIDTHGVTGLQVTNSNITSKELFATTSPNSYTYTFYLKSHNGTNLGEFARTYKYGTTNTLEIPQIEGYTSPATYQKTWDVANNAGFDLWLYQAEAVENLQISGTLSQALSNQPLITYVTTPYYRNRTATSVEVLFETTVTMSPIWDGFSYGVAYYTDTLGKLVLAPYNSLSRRGATYTSSSDWVTIPLYTTDKTTLTFNGYMFEINSNGSDISSMGYGPCIYPTWVVNIPAY